MERPKIVDDIDLTDLKKLCEKFLDDVGKGITDDDFSQWFLETVMETFYGKDIFKYINGNVK